MHCKSQKDENSVCTDKAKVRSLLSRLSPPLIRLGSFLLYNKIIFVAEYSPWTLLLNIFQVAQGVGDLFVHRCAEPLTLSL